VQSLEGSIDREIVATLLESLDGDTKILSELIATYLDDTPQRLAEIEQAAERADLHTLARETHTLKSTSMAFGAFALASACSELQRQAAAGSATGGAAQVQVLKEEFARVRAGLSCYL
jgi:HPt (histidine-containing phosphotransfer) domain-containing protein